MKHQYINLPVILTLVTIAGCVSPLIRVFELQSESPEWFLWLFVVAQLIMIWESMSSWSRINTDHKPLLGSIINLIVPFLFGASLIYIWEILTVGFNVPQILLPSPHLIALAFAKSTSVLWADFQQTFVKAVLSGYLMGCGSGFLVAILIDRVPFLQKGLLPLGNLVSALRLHGAYGTGSHVFLCLKLFAVPAFASSSKCITLHFQCSENQFHTCANWSDCGRILWYSNRWNGF